MARVYVINDKTGRKGYVQSTEYNNAVKEGFRLETDQEQENRFMDAEYSGAGSAATAALLGAARGVTFGTSDQLLRLSGLAGWAKGYKKYEPTASMVGEGVGIVGSLVAGGGAGKVAGAGTRTAARISNAAEQAAARSLKGMVEKGVLGRVVKGAPKVVGGAVDGALYGTGHVISEQALGNTELTAEKVISTIGTSALLGGAIGGVASAAGQMLGKLSKDSASNTTALIKRHANAINGLPEDIQHIADKGSKGPRAAISNWLQEFAKERAIKAAGMQKKHLRKMSTQEADDIASTMLDDKLADGTPVLHWRDGPKTTAEKFIRKEKEIQEVLASNYDEIEKIVGTKGADELKPSLDVVMQNYYKATEKFRKNTFYKEAVENADNHLKSWFKEVDGKGRLGFREMLLKRQNIEDQVWKDGINPYAGAAETNRNEVLRTLRYEMEDEVIAAGDRAAKSINSSVDYVPAIKHAKKLFKTYHDLRKVAEDVLIGGVSGNRYYSISDQAFGIGGFMASMAFGSIAPAAALKGVAFAQGAKVLRERGSVFLADLSNRVGKMMAIENSVRAANKSTSGIVQKFLSPTAKTMATPRIAVPVAVTYLNNMTFASPGEGKGSDIYDVYNRRYKELANLVSNPKSFIENMSNRLETMREVAPGVAQHLATKAASIAQFLYDKAPVNPNADYGISPLATKWKPTKAQIIKWTRYIRAANQPSSVLEDMESGRLTIEAVETIKTLYPMFYEEIKQNIIEHAAQLEENIPYKKRLMVSQFFGVPLDSSMEPDFINWMQGLYSAQPQQTEGRGPGGVRQAGLDNLDMAGMSASQSQKIGATR